jgi:hypothetical protein
MAIMARAISYFEGGCPSVFDCVVRGPAWQKAHWTPSACAIAGMFGGGPGLETPSGC